ncbi:Vitamin B12-dependent ribonucleoside-diphosphate reductase [Streptomyces microflavus]
MANGSIDWDRLDSTVRTAVTFLDRVVDINFYPTEQAGRSNSRWRPVGLGAMGLQDVFFQLRLPFDSPQARALSTKISERIMLRPGVLRPGQAFGPLPAWSETRAARGVLHPDHYDTELNWPERWDALRARVAKTGMRNSLLLAIAPTATIASIAGVYECIEPQVSNLFKRETLSGEFLQVNAYLHEPARSSVCGTPAPVRRCARRAARCRASPGSPRTCGRCTAPRGRSRSAA